jgi:hypothetical protein
MTLVGVRRGVGLLALIALIAVGCQSGVDRSLTPDGTWILDTVRPLSAEEAEPLPFTLTGDPEAEDRLEVVQGTIIIRGDKTCQGVLAFRQFFGPGAEDFTPDASPDTCTWSTNEDQITFNWSQNPTQTGTWGFNRLRLEVDGNVYTYRR